MDIGATLRGMRKRKRLKQTEVVKMLGIPFGTYNSYETKGVEPPIETLIKLAELFGTDINKIVGFKTEEDFEKERQKLRKESLLNLLRAERIIVNSLITELEKHCEEDEDNG